MSHHRFSPPHPPGAFVCAAYTIAITDELSSQFARFVTLNPHQLAGHVANLEFWSQEVAHRLSAIDSDNERFRKMDAAQKEYASDRATVEFELADSYGDSARGPIRPRRIREPERISARRRLCDNFYRFIARCSRDGLIDEKAARRDCARHNIGVDPRDLRSRNNEGA